MEECVFCKIAKGEIHSHKIWEDKEHVALLSIFPNTPGFSVVLTKRHYPSYAFANSDEVLNNLVLATKKVARILDATFKDVGRCGMFFEGFGVDHLHSKLFPMHGTRDMKEWKPIEDVSQRKEFYEKYPGFLTSHESKRADDGELAKLARKIKQTAKRLGI